MASDEQALAVETAAATEAVPTEPAKKPVEKRKTRGAKPKAKPAAKRETRKKPAAAAPPPKPKSPPSHPSYEEMIKDAIVTLKERNGSSQYAIQKFIEEKEKHLPSNFRKLLLSLKKQVISLQSFSGPPLHPSLKSRIELRCVIGNSTSPTGENILYLFSLILPLQIFY